MDVRKMIGIQTEKGEVAVFADGTIADVKATKSHKQMKKDEVTDIVPEGTFIGSDHKSMQIKDSELENIDFGFAHVKYEEGKISDLPEKVEASKFMNKKGKTTPAQYLKNLRKHYDLSDADSDIFTEVTNKENLVARTPYINLIEQLTEKKKSKKSSKKEVESFQSGGTTGTGPFTEQQQLETLQNQYPNHSITLENGRWVVKSPSGATIRTLEYNNVINPRTVPDTIQPLPSIQNQGIISNQPSQGLGNDPLNPIINEDDFVPQPLNENNGPLTSASDILTSRTNFLKDLRSRTENFFDERDDRLRLQERTSLQNAGLNLVSNLGTTLLQSREEPRAFTSERFLNEQFRGPSQNDTLNAQGQVRQSLQSAISSGATGDQLAQVVDGVNSTVGQIGAQNQLTRDGLRSQLFGQLNANANADIQEEARAQRVENQRGRQQIAQVGTSINDFLRDRQTILERFGSSRNTSEAQRFREGVTIDSQIQQTAEQQPFLEAQLASLDKLRQSGLNGNSTNVNGFTIVPNSNGTFNIVDVNGNIVQANVTADQIQ